MPRPTLCLAAPLVLLLAACGGPAPVARPTTAVAHPDWPVLLAEEVEGLGLFREDAERSAAMLATWAGEHGVGVADAAHARQVLARAFRGESPTTGAKCGLPLASWRARERYATELGAGGRLRGDVRCEKEACTLRVTASSGLDFDGTDLAAWEAPYDARAPWADALRASLAALRPANEEGVGGLLGIGNVGDARVVAEPEQLGFSAWHARAFDPAEDEALKGAVALDARALRPCVAPHGAVELLLQANASGRVDRCESREGADEAASCACAVFMRDARVSEKGRLKPLYVGTHYRAADVVTPANAVVHATIGTHLDEYKNRDGEARFRPRVSDRAIADWKEPSQAAVDACFRDASVGTLHFAVRTTFDAVGKATHATAKGHATPEQRACLERAFLTARAPCPSTPSSTADATVEVTVKDITP